MQCKSLEEIDVIAKEILSLTTTGVVILQGDLAAGKTTLVKAIAKELGLHDAVTSPTFTLQQNYDDILYHYDIYNQGLEQFMALGLFEELEKKALHCIEWGDERLKEFLIGAGLPVVLVHIRKEDNMRCYRIENAS